MIASGVPNEQQATAPECSDRPRTSAPPPTDAAHGIGVIVHGPDGVPLGRQRLSAWAHGDGCPWLPPSAHRMTPRCRTIPLP